MFNKFVYEFVKELFLLFDYWFNGLVDTCLMVLTISYLDVSEKVRLIVLTFQLL